MAPRPGGVALSLRRLLLGRPLRSDESGAQRIGVIGALPLLCPDALSSVAYGTQAILVVLASAGTLALWYSLPISAVIGLLLVVLVISYRQVILAYPGGGGAYVVGKETLGPVPSLVAGASLLIDYTLNIAVSAAAGVAAVIAALPMLLAWRVELCVGLVLLMTAVNLRGTRESSLAFGPPTYLFIVMVLVMVAAAMFEGKMFLHPAHPILPAPVVPGLALFVVLRAFSSGSTALTGVEAISNGVPLFKPDSVVRARATMVTLGLLLGVMFLGTSFAAFGYGIVPAAQSTVLQQLAAAIFGRGIFFYLLAFVTMGILLVSANTSFAGFPQLASLMARDGWMPRLFLTKGDRLVYQNGILVIGAAASLLLVIFQGSVIRLIPLFAIGVYIGFTITQVGLIKKHLTERSGQWPTMVAMAGGALLTATVVVVALATKFLEGAWIVALVLPAMVVTFFHIRRHYLAMNQELRLPDADLRPKRQPMVAVVPFSGISRTSQSSLSYALSISENVVAVNVAFSDEQEAQVKEAWAAWAPDPSIRLVVLRSPYRSVTAPVMAYIDRLQGEVGQGQVIVLIPEFVVGRWWQYLLHNQVGLVLQANLVFRKDVVVAMVPFRLSGR